MFDSELNPEQEKLELFREIKWKEREISDKVEKILSEEMNEKLSNEERYNLAAEIRTSKEVEQDYPLKPEMATELEISEDVQEKIDKQCKSLFSEWDDLIKNYGAFTEEEEEEDF